MTERMLVEIVMLEKRWVTERNFQGGGGSRLFTNDFWRQKTRVPGYHVALFA